MKTSVGVDLGQAHESALKEAETDAMKRALMTFGNPFGLALYDKAQRQVSSAAAQGTVGTALVQPSQLRLSDGDAQGRRKGSHVSLGVLSRA